MGAVPRAARIARPPDSQKNGHFLGQFADTGTAHARRMDSSNSLATLVTLARHLRVPVRWLRKEADAGRLPHIKAGSQRLFNVATVERLLSERAAQEAPAPRSDGLAPMRQEEA